MTKGIKSYHIKYKVYFLIFIFYYIHLESWSDLGVRILTIQVHLGTTVLEINTTDLGFCVNQSHPILIWEWNNDAFCGKWFLIPTFSISSSFLFDSSVRKLLKLSNRERLKLNLKIHHVRSNQVSCNYDSLNLWIFDSWENSIIRWF